MIFNKIVHALENRYEKFKIKRIAKFRIRKSRDYWQSIKDKHKGQRGFVIGNGPSLRFEDLNKLKGEVSIASNKIYLAFDSVDWRPSYYTSCDLILWDKIKNKIGHYFEKIHTASFVHDIPDSISARTYTWRSLSKRRHSDVGKFHFSGNMSQGAFAGGSVTYDNLQLAVHLGLNPIYLIGCDHFYAGEPSDLGKSMIIETQEHNNHFVKGYRSPGEKVPSADIRLMTQSYEQARKYAETNHISIYNTTRGGHLEVFERVDFDSLF